MIVPLMFRRAVAVSLAVLLGCAALPGCGNKPGPTQADKKDEPKKDDPKVDPKVDPKKIDTTNPPPTALSKVEPDAEKMAEAFLKSLGEGTATADALSTGFLKSVSKPLELPDDIKHGFSRDNATRWLKRVGENYNFSASLFRQQAGDAVFWRGLVTGPALPGGGGYSLRLVKEGGAWKVDWLGLSATDIKGSVATGAPDAAFQEFAVTSFVEVLTDAKAMSDETRPPVIAHAMTADLRKKWAPPGAQDMGQGYDYSPGHLRLAAVKCGGGTKEFTVAKAGDLTFSVVLTKPAGPKTIVVKLVKGTTAGEWLVTEVTETAG